MGERQSLQIFFRIFTICIFIASSGFSENFSEIDIQKKSCLQRSDTQRLMNLFDFLGAENFELCNSDNLVNRTLNSVLFIEALNEKFSPENSPFFSGTVDQSPHDFFKSRIKKIVFESQCKIQHTMAYVLPPQVDTLHLCPEANTLSSYRLAASLIHEARHFDGFDHVSCAHGRFAGIKDNMACDPSLETKGAYAAQVDFGIQLSRNEALHPALRAEALANAADLLVDRFNKLPGDIQYGAFLFAPAENNKQEVRFFNGSSESFAFHIEDNQLFVSDNEGPKLINRQTYSVTELSPAFRERSTMPNYDDKNGSSQLLELLRVNDILCTLEVSTLRCLSESDPSQNHAIEFIDSKPVGLFSLRDKNNGTSLYLTKDNGELLRVTPSMTKIKLLDEKKWIGKFLNIKKMQPWGQKFDFIGLNTNGYLFKKTRSDKIHFFSNQNKYSNLVAPIIWSPSLGKL